MAAVMGFLELESSQVIWWAMAELSMTVEICRCHASFSRQSAPWTVLLGYYLQLHFDHLLVIIRSALL